MNTREHDELIELLGRAPRMALDALRATGLVTLPPFSSVRVEPGDLRELVPPARAVDVVLLLDEAQRTVFALLIEVQGGPDPDKRFTWPFYQHAVRARFRCPACLMVLALSDEVAQWAAQPIPTGQPGAPFLPLVVTGAQFPRVTDADEARREPHAAILATLLHGHEPGAEHLAVAAAAGAELLPPDERDMWLELMAASLNEVSRKALEAMMNISEFRDRSVWFKEGEQKGHLAGLDEGRQAGLDEGRQALRAAIEDMAELLGLEVNASRRTALASLDLAGLESLRRHLKQQRAWPEST